MFATPQTQQLLFDLQSLDIDARKIRHEAEELEETKHLERLIAQRKAIVIERHKLSESIAQLRASSDALDADITKLKTQVGAIDLKLKASGVTPKEVVALTKQQEGLAAQISGLEDSQMEKLSEIETLEKDDAILQQNDEKLHSTGPDLKNRREDKLGGLKKRMASVNAKRKIAVSSIPKDILDLYTQMSKNAQGNVVVRFVAGRVDGMHLELSVAQLHTIEDTDPDELVILEDEGVIVARP
jgi:predicted  nucleic acid-binding Zn-ribbon protein